MQTGTTRLKLCVRILSVTLKSNSRGGLKHPPSEQRSILSGGDLAKGDPCADLLERQAFSRLVRGNFPEISSPSQKQFRIIVPMEASVRELKSLIIVQFRRLYPEEDPLLVRYIREEGVDCDLDDDFLVGDFFTTDKFVLALCETITTVTAMNASPSPIVSCEAIAMPRPLVTPMSEMGEVLHKELLSSSPALNLEMILPSLSGANVPTKTRKRKRREKTSSVGVQQEGQSAKKSPMDLSSATFVANAKTPEEMKELGSMVTDVPVFYPAERQGTRSLSSPIAVDEKAGTTQATAVGSNQADSKPPAEADSKVVQPFAISRKSPREPVVPRSSPTSNMKCEPQLATTSVLPATEMKDAEVASLIQAMESPSSSDDDVADLTIPVVKSRLTTATLRPLVGASPITATPAPNSSENEENDDFSMETATAIGPNTAPTHRTSLTALTEELRRSSAASPIPPVATKILAPINANNTEKPRRRRNQRKKEVSPGPTTS